jgi:hypothetical protein
VNVKNGKVLDVSGNVDKEGQKVHVWRRHNGLNQRWRVVYVDSRAAMKKKGVNKNFGLQINRPFFVFSRMPMRRAIIAGYGNYHLRVGQPWFNKNDKRYQFVFDQSSKTIRHVYSRSRSWSIHSQGRASTIGAETPTNSRWW